MSMRGSPINWWKEKRQSSHTGIPHANRPQTAFPWNEDRDISKIVEQAVLAAFESNAFKIAVASQVDPAFSRHQEKLNQIKTTNLNLESTLQAHVEDLPGVLKGIEDQLTRVVIPDYRHSLDTLALGQESLESKVNEIHIPDHSDELNEIVSGQTRFLKTFETRLSALESRLEDLDRKTGDVDEAVVNADLRSAIRFGEISNELQDRNTTLNNSIWEVQRELGKKTDALQRRVVGACEDMGKSIRASAETIETMRAKLDEDDVLAAVDKVYSRAEFSEKALRRSITAIQDKVSGLDTSAIPVQIAKLETIERGMSDFKKEAEAARNLASVSSKFLSANTSKLDSMASAVGKMHLLVESTNEICQEVSESQEANAGSIKEDVEAVRMHVRSLDNLAVSHSRKLSDATSILTRTEGAVVAFDAAVIGRLGDLASSTENIEERLRPLSSHSTKLDGLETSLTALVKDSKPQRATLDDLTKTLSEMRSNVDTALSSHTDSLSTIHQTVSNTASKDGLSTALSNLQSSIEKKISSSHETASQSTVEVITTHVGSLDGKLQNGFRSIKDESESHAEKLHTPISEILEEVRSSKALFETEKAEIREEFNTTRTAIEASRSELGADALSIKRMIQDIQEAGRDEEILLQVESWGQNCITKQAAEVASVKELLEILRGRDENLQQSVDGLNEKSAEIDAFLRSGELECSHIAKDLNALKTLLSDDSKLDSLTDIANQTSQTLNTIKHFTQQNTSSLATAYEGILSLDTKLTTNSDTVHSTLQEMQTALGRDILDATTSITTSMHDDVAELKADLSSRVSTSMNVLRAEIKSIDLATTSSALQALKTEVESAAKDSKGVSEDMKASIQNKIEDLGRDVKDFGDTLGKDLQLNNAALERLKELSTAQHTTLSSDIAHVQETVNPTAGLVDGVSTVAGLARDIDAVTKGNVESMSAMQESLAVSAKQTDTHLTKLKSSVGAEAERILQALQASHTVLTDVQKSHTEGLAQTTSSLNTIEAELSSVATSSKETEAAILASAAGISAEILAVKSGVDGVATSVMRVEGHATKAEDVQTQVLAAVQTSSGQFESVQVSLKRIEDVNASSFTGIKTDITDLGTSLTKHHADLASDVRVANSNITDLTTALSKATTSNAASHESALAALQAESKLIQDAVRAEAEKGSGKVLERIEVLDKVVVDAVGDLKVVLEDRVDNLAAKVGELGTTLSQVTTESKEAHAATLATLHSEYQATRDAFTAELEKTSNSTTSKLDVVQEAIIADATSTREKLLAEVKGLESSIQESKDQLVAISTETSEKFDGLAKEAGDRHEATIAALRAESRTLRDAVTAESEKTNATMSANLESTKSSVLSSVEDCKTAVLTDLVAVKASSQGCADAIAGLSTATTLKLAEAAAEAKKTQQNVIASIEAQSGVMSDTFTREVKDVNRAIESARDSIVAEVERIMIGVDDKIGAVEKTLVSGLDVVKKELAEEVGKNAKDFVDRAERLSKDIDAGFLKADTRHEATLKVMKEECKSLNDVILSESKNMDAAITAAKDLTLSEVQQSKTSIDEKLNSVEKTLSAKLGETNEVITQELEHVVSKADKIHNTTLEAIKLTSETCSSRVNSAELVLKDAITEISNGADKHHDTTLAAITLSSQTCLTGLDRTELHLRDIIKELSNDINAASHRSTTNHTTTLDALTLSRTTLTDHISSELSTSTATHRASTQSLLTSLSTAQSTLDTLQTTTTKFSTETAAHFSSAASARKKAEKKSEANTDTILEAIRQQGKTTSSSVDAVQKVVLTGVQNLNSSLEGFIERVIEKSGSDVVDVVRTGLEDVKSESVETRKALDEKIEGVMENVKEEAATMRKFTTAMDTNTANLSSQLTKGLSDLSTESKATSTALDTHVSTLSAAVKDEAETTQARVETLHSRVLDEVQKTDTALRSSLNTLKSSIEKSETTLKQTDAKIEALTPGLKAIDAAVRVNSAAIARVDKAVLESSSQVKSEINSSINSLSTQLDDELSETSRRVRGIAEFEIPRLEVLLRRQRDAVEVIGGRVIGTTKRFDEMVAGIGKGGGGNGGLGGSEILGMGGRLRGGSNASSTRSKDSGYRMGAFESGGRM